MDAALFAADLAAKPEHLNAYADVLAASDPWQVLPSPVGRIVFVGMGSSAYAAGVCAARLRARGALAVSELASSDLLPAARDGDVVVAVSAGGGSRETRSAVDGYRGRAPVVLLTNSPDSELSALADAVVPMHAGTERGGVACRSYQHTLVALLALERHLLGLDRDLPALVRTAAAAGADLADRADDWLPQLRAWLDGPQGVHVAAPARRSSSALQSALMLREGPRRQAYACETGDWSHVDVYLTKTTDYRLLLLAGSRWEDELLRWARERGSTVVAVGADVDGAAMSLRYPHDDDDDVRLLTEVLVAELLAAELWRRDAARP
jgi:fructoselysine-6-P-deglycase FrlB-like protein